MWHYSVHVCTHLVARIIVFKVGSNRLLRDRIVFVSDALVTMSKQYILVREMQFIH